MEFPEAYRGAVTSANAVEATEGLETSNPNEGDQGVKAPRVLILYGSETGTAEAAAFRLARKLKLCKPLVAALNEVAGLDVVQERGINKILALTSTFGKGDAPSNAGVFAETEIPEGLLDNTDVAVLALGSTLYPDYCKAGIALFAQLRKAGGKQILPLKKVDDAAGSDAPITQWIDLVSRLVVPNNLQKILESRAGSKKTPIRYELTWKKDGQMKDKIERFAWPEEESCLCLENEELMEGGNVDSRSTRKITYEIPEGQSYVSGDHLAVHPLNSMDMVRRFAACFGDELIAACSYASSDDRAEIIEYQLQQPFTLDCIEDGDRLPARLAFSTPETLSSALQAYVDLALRPSSVLDLLQVVKKALNSGDVEGPLHDGLVASHGFAGDDADKCRQLAFHIKDIVERKGDTTEQMEMFAQTYPTVVEFLEAFQQVLCVEGASKMQKGPLLTLADVLPLLPKLRARHYSISSSDKIAPNKVSVSVGVVHVKTPKGAMIHGVCSNYQARLTPGKDRVKIAIRSSNFRGPKDVTSPMILVGSGTGLAPMMGFIQDRALDVAEFAGSGVGEAHLFFGCRSYKERIYSSLVDKWVEEGVLKQHLALSREPGVPKKYVQQALKDTGAELCKLLLREDTHYYICGDAKVGDECYEACVNILRMHGDMSRVGAVAHIKRMRVENRWQYDLWGIITHFVDSKRRVKNKAQQRSSDWLKSFE